MLMQFIHIIDVAIVVHSHSDIVCHCINRLQLKKSFMLLKDTWTASNSVILQMTFLWTFWGLSFGATPHVSHLKVELLDYRTCPCSVSVDIASSPKHCVKALSLQQCTRHCAHPCQHMTLSACLSLPILVGLWLYLVVSTCIALLTLYPFICLVAIWIVSVVRDLYKGFGFFFFCFTGLHAFFLFTLRILEYILHMNYVSVACFEILSCLPFHSLNGGF